MEESKAAAEIEKQKKELELKEKELNLIQEQATSNNSGATSSFSESSPILNLRGKLETVRLPKLELPHFDGDIETWPNFRDAFQSSIAQRHMADRDKLKYLKSLCQGAASDVVNGFDDTNDSYKEAWAALERIYGDTDAIINSHLSAIQQLSLTSVDTPSLRKFFNNFDTHLRRLRSLKVVLDEDRILMNNLRQLFSKASKDLFMTLDTERKRKEGSPPFTVKSCLWIFYRIIFLNRERVERLASGGKSITGESNSVSSTEQVSSQPPGGEKWTEPVQSSAQALAARTRKKLVQPVVSNQSGRNQPSRCQFCGGQHYANQCTVYSGVEGRKARISELNLCFICLVAGHQARFCPNQGKQCYYCHRTGHHQAVCFHQFGVANQNQEGSRRVHFAESQENEEPTVQSEAQSSVGVVANSVISKGTQVFKETQSLFQLARPTAYSQCASRKAFLLLDSGSDRCYISSNFADRSIKSFGSVRGGPHHSQAQSS